MPLDRLTMKETIDFIAPDFSVDMSYRYSLSIRQLPDGYSFCIHDDDRCIAIKHKPITKGIKSPSEQLRTEPLLQLQYRNAMFFGYGSYTIIPKSFAADNNACFLPLSQQLQRRADTVINAVSDEAEIVGYTNRWNCPNLPLQMHHEAELLISAAMHTDTPTSLWAEIVDNHINITINRNGKLALCNTYSIASAIDASYFILACYQQFGFDHEDIPLYITGLLSDTNPTAFLSDYIRHIHVVIPKLWSDEISNDNKNSVFTLQTKYHLLCE